MTDTNEPDPMVSFNALKKGSSGKKDLPDYGAPGSRITGDTAIDDVLNAVGASCARLEKIGFEMDSARDEMEAATAKTPPDAGRVAALKTKMTALMSQISEIEDKILPSLMQMLGQAGQEGLLNNGVAQKAQEALKAVSRMSDLDASGEPAGNEEGDSPWA